jgi:hypothetical protein
VRRLRGRLFIAAVDHDPGAETGQQFGDRQADPATAADDNGTAARERPRGPWVNPCSRSA